MQGMIFTPLGMDETTFDMARALSADHASPHAYDIDGKPSCVRTLHSESNALDRAGLMTEPHTMYCTTIPCHDCALRIIQNGWIKRVIYAEYYESRSTKDVEALFGGYDDDTCKLIGARTPRVERERRSMREPPASGRTRMTMSSTKWKIREVAVASTTAWNPSRCGPGTA